MEGKKQVLEIRAWTEVNSMQEKRYFTAKFCEEAIIQTAQRGEEKRSNKVSIREFSYFVTPQEKVDV